MTIEPPLPPPVLGRSLSPAVSWGAIFAGAAVGLAVSLMLTILAAGLGLSLGFPGLASRASLDAFTPAAGAYAMVVQVLSAMLGGYVTGRLRHIWHDVHLDEAHFRDTANGLVAWAVMSVAAVILAARVLAPYAEALAGPAAMAAAMDGAPMIDPVRAAGVAAQSSLFIGIGMLLSAFVAAVAARIGGQQSETMHIKAMLPDR